MGIQIDGVELEIDEIQTLDPIDCASKKAIEAYRQYGKPILVENTTLFFKAWNGLPGVFVDYFMKTVGNSGLLQFFENESNRDAYAQTTLATSQDGIETETFVGKVDGFISMQERGDNGFGWDPIFIPKDSGKTFAEMTGKEKDKYSMRKLAFRKFKQALGK